MTYFDGGSIAAMMHLGTNQLNVTESNLNKKMTYSEYEKIYEGCKSVRNQLKEELKKIEEIYDSLISVKTSIYESLQKTIDYISSELLKGDWLSSSKHLLVRLEDELNYNQTILDLLKTIPVRNDHELEKNIDFITTLINTKEKFISYYEEITDNEKKQELIKLCEMFKPFVLSTDRLVGRSNVTTLDRLILLLNHYKDCMNKVKF